MGSPQGTIQKGPYKWNDSISKSIMCSDLANNYETWHYIQGDLYQYDSIQRFDYRYFPYSINALIFLASCSYAKHWLMKLLIVRERGTCEQSSFLLIHFRLKFSKHRQWLAVIISFVSLVRLVELSFCFVITSVCFRRYVVAKTSEVTEVKPS